MDYKVANMSSAEDSVTDQGYHNADDPFVLLMEYIYSLLAAIKNGSTPMNVTAVTIAMSRLKPKDRAFVYNVSGTKSVEELLCLLNSSSSLCQTQQPAVDLTTLSQYNVSKLLLLYISPIILLVGTLGNTFSFVVLRRKPMAKVSTYIYLASLAVTDTVVLYIGLLRLWLDALIGLDYLTVSDWVCKICVVVGYVASNLSVWLIIAVTVERFIVVCFPFRANVMCNVSRAKKVIAFLTCLILAIYLQFFWTVGVIEGRCDALEGYFYLVKTVWPWIDAGIYSFFPFFIIMILNALIIREVKGAQSTRVQLGATDYSSNSGNYQCQAKAAAASDQKRRQQAGEKARLTVMLLTVSFTFLFLTLPVNILLIFTKYFNQNIYKHKLDSDKYGQWASFNLAKSIIELLMYTNHSINFFLYCATGHKFRQQVLLLFRCLRRISCCPPSGGSGKRSLRKTSASILGHLSDVTQTSRYGRRKSSSCVSLDLLETRVNNSCGSASAREDSSSLSRGATLEVQLKMINTSSCSSSRDGILANSNIKSRSSNGDGCGGGGGGGGCGGGVGYFPSSPQKYTTNVRHVLLTMEDGNVTSGKNKSTRKKSKSSTSFKSYAKNGVCRFKKMTRASYQDVNSTSTCSGSGNIIASPPSSSTLTGCRVVYSSKKNSAPVQRRLNKRCNVSDQCLKDDELSCTIVTTQLGRVASSQF